MNILVLGGAGYIGSITAAALLDAGHKVVVLDSLVKGHRKAVDPRATFVQGDLADARLVGDLCTYNHIDAAMHFAAFIEVGESVAEPARYFENNTVKTKALLDALVESGVKKFVFSSTAAVYGEPQHVPIDEDHAKAPTSPYGWSKLFVEEILGAYGRAYGLKSTIFRYFNAAGAGALLGEDHVPETHLIPLVLQAAAGKRPSIKVFGADWPTPDGTCVRDYIHVEDLAAAHVLGVEALGRGGEGGVYNLGNGEGYSVREVIEVARKVTGREIRVEETGRRAGDPARLVASSARARKELGWSPRRASLEEIVRSAWAWFEAHPSGYGDRGGGK